jgi:hypothetical protein
MSLKGKFKTNAVAVRDGVWFDVGENSDKTKCRVKLRRTGRGNPLWSIAFREHTKDRDMDAVTPEEDEIITAEIFAEASVADWEHMQPDDDGKDVPFSVDAAKALLVDPDWIELLKDWQTKANSLAPFQAKREKEAKN